ncbi:2'-5' RNA ligase [Nocardioides scoriae]|uniref:2'-5' RNA ligase n=1 Tax=Nocardioides scoriae TaxID=642780 RepID=A0A1H1XQF7_9ACTN|nr:2'-5' RNA ligase family protein [Nocardioides scoriae]SDT11443.1 2'-5' RNA ligase [Nocardioides scoriae]
MTANPLIVSLLLDDETQARFTAQRRAFFPAERLVVDAHLTLFHALPATLHDDVAEALREAADRPPLDVRVHDVYSLNRGVAYRLLCEDLDRLHAGWRRRWSEHLTRQDAQPLHAHVTVQNKVSSTTARHTLDELRAEFRPWVAHGTALELWRYDGGPWTHLERFDLRT